MDQGLKQPTQTLPEGKCYHFFIVAAEEDRDKVSTIISSVKENFNLKCLYEATDCKPGQDKFEFIKSGMIQSVKVVLFLSERFMNDIMCTYQRNIALAASLDVRIPAIIPVLLEQLDHEVLSDIANLTFIDASGSEVLEVSGKIAESVLRADLHATMFQDFTNVFARFENGYSVEMSVKREALSCNRPAKYKFCVDEEFHTLLNDSRMQIPDELLQDVVKFINKEPIMKSYDFLKKRNIVCWGIVFLPFAVLLGALIALIAVVAMFTPERPDPYSNQLDFIVILVMIGSCVPGLYVNVLIVIVLALPRICHREKKDIDLQTKICQHFLRRCIKNDIIIVFSGRKNRRPSLHIVRYSFDKCRAYLESFVGQVNNYNNTENENWTTKEFANHLIEQKVVEMSKLMSKSYDELPDASYPRHNVRKQKMCLCQQIELNLHTLRQRSNRSDRTQTER